MSKRICPPEAFSIAHNSLNIFLTEYPHMNEEQVGKIIKLVERFGQPEIRHNRVRRPALFCKARQDGTLIITPITVRSVESEDQVRTVSPAEGSEKCP